MTTMEQTRARIDRLAKLANLRLTEAERARLTEELPRILAFVDQLQRVSVESVPPTDQVTDLENIHREDTVEPFPHHRAIIEAAPHRRDDLIRAPGIFTDRRGERAT